jgi:hypothetical protein
VVATFVFLETRSAPEKETTLSKPEQTDTRAITAAASSNAAPTPPSAAVDAGTVVDTVVTKPSSKTGTPGHGPMPKTSDRKLHAPKAAPAATEDNDRDRDPLDGPAPQRREDPRTRAKNRAPAIMKRGDF